MRFFSSEQLISWFAQRDIDGSLDLSPSFQRRSVWTSKQKSTLIDSILQQFPIPEIYIRTITRPDGTSTYSVVDGQQRITAILEFLGVGTRAALEIGRLDFVSPWDGYTFDRLSDEEKSRFYGHSLAVRYLTDVTTEEIEDLFRRLNKYVTPLSPQELRNATFTGPFIKLAESLADDPYWAENRIVEPTAIRRMRDIEFVSDLLIGVMHGPQSGNALTLDEFYRQYEEYDSEFPRQTQTRRVFNRVLDLLQLIFPDIKDTRWRNRTDFYTLFVVLSGHMRTPRPVQDPSGLRDALDDLSNAIDLKRENEDADVPLHVIDYIRATERGSSDRSRRVTRHQALDAILAPLF